jgi:hypothetical protein
MDGDMNSNTQEVFVIDGIMTITPYCVSATLSSKPATTVIVSAGIEGILLISSRPCEGGIKPQETKYNVGSPITALISISNSPLVIAGAFDGSIHCIHIGKKSGSDDKELSVSVLLKEQVSREAVTTLSYQAATKKLAVVTSRDDHCEVAIVCLEPNNMKTIGAIRFSELVSSLAWGPGDFKLLASHSTFISCYETIGMTFGNNAENIWTKPTGLNNLHAMSIDASGNYGIAIDGKRRGVFVIAISNGPTLDAELEVKHVAGDCNSSASSCLLIDESTPGRLVLGTISGEIMVCDVSDEGQCNVFVSSGTHHKCTVTSIYANKDGFCSVGMDGTVVQHKVTKTGETSIAPSSAQWDYLIMNKEDVEAVELKASVESASKQEEKKYELYRKEYECPIKETPSLLDAVKLVSKKDLLVMKAAGSKADHKDGLLLYSAHDTTSGLSILTDNEIQTLVDIRDVQKRLQEEYNDEALSNQVFVNIGLGETGLHKLGESDEYFIIDSNTVFSKKETNAKLMQHIAKISVSVLLLFVHSFILYPNFSLKSS